METIKQIIAENLIILRKKNNLTQLELAEKLNYTDKAVSRWEKGDTLPDIDVLCRICDIYNITFDSLIKKGDFKEISYEHNKIEWGHRITIMLLAIMMVWFAATVLFVCLSMIKGINFWQFFVYAVPVSVFVIKLFNMKWGKLRFGLALDTVFIWSLLCSIYISALKYNLWVIFILGVPTQILLILKYNLDRIKKLHSDPSYKDRKENSARKKSEKKAIIAEKNRLKKENDKLEKAEQLKLKEESKKLKKLIKTEKQNYKLEKEKSKNEKKLNKLYKKTLRSDKINANSDNNSIE